MEAYFHLFKFMNTNKLKRSIPLFTKIYTKCFIKLDSFLFFTELKFLIHDINIM